MQRWRATCESYGWSACPLLFNVHEELVRDNPAAAASEAEDAAVTRSLSIGIPHPQHGVMRATMYVTSAPTLTRLAAIAYSVARHQFATSAGLPHLYVGASHFVDRVDSKECVIVGVLVFSGPAGDVQCAPMTLVRWRDLWLPYFEDVNAWVLTGWDGAGRTVEIFKPIGWGCPVLAADHRRSGRSSRSSRSSRIGPGGSSEVGSTQA